MANADHPTALAFAPDGRLFFAEQYTGKIRVVTADGKLQDEPFATLDVANWLNEDWGLTGLALDPDFATNHFVYAFYTELAVADSSRPIGKPKLVRFTDSNNRGGSPTTIADDFPETFVDHQGFKTNGKIHFGPDGYLYVTIGNYDMSQPVAPVGKPPTQDLSSPIGKMLRVKKGDGSGPADNPFAGQASADPRVFAYGFGQPFDFAFHPQTGAIYGSDNSDSCEELNLIKAGGNYGGMPIGDFPHSDCTGGDQIKAIHFLAREGKQAGEFQSYVNVSGFGFVSAQTYPSLGDSLLACEALTGQMRRLTLSGAAFDQVTDDTALVKDCTGSIATSPDGTAYYSNLTEIRHLLVKEKK